jgi:hypothetical protein
MQSFEFGNLREGECFVKNVFRGGGTIAEISPLPVFVGLKRISSLTTIFKYSNHDWQRLADAYGSFVSAVALCGALGISGCFSRTNNQVCVVSGPK